MRRLDYPPARYHAPPERQVEEDAALEAGVEPPCRALVLAGPMPGDWCWCEDCGQSVAILLTPMHPPEMRGRRWFTHEAWADGGWGQWMMSFPRHMRPLYRTWGRHTFEPLPMAGTETPF